MDSIISNFKRMTLFRLIGVVMALVIIIGALVPYAMFEGFDSFSLISTFPIGGIIIIVAALATIAGVAFGKKIISIVGAAVALAADIAIPFFLKTASFYNNFVGVDGLVGGTNEDLAEAFGDAYVEAEKEINDEMAQMMADSFSYKIGFYLILAAAVIATVAFIIDIIRSDKEIEERVMQQATQARSIVDTFAETIVENTVSEDGGMSVRGEGLFFKRKKEPWLCPNCNETNDGSATFCVFCGKARPKPKICYKCGTPLEDHMRFCPKCGTEYDEEKANERYAEEGLQGHSCIYCGAELPAGAMFCGKCGKPQ